MTASLWSISHDAGKCCYSAKKLEMSVITVAIAGGTGQLGNVVPWSPSPPVKQLFPIGANIVNALLSKHNHPSRVGKVIVFTRDSSSDKAKALTKQGAEVVQVEDIGISTDLLKGVDVFISAASFMATPTSQEEWVKAAVKAGVKVYFPSDYGM